MSPCSPPVANRRILAFEMILKRLRKNEVAYTIVFAASLLLVGGGLLYSAYRYSGRADTSSVANASRGSSSAQSLDPATGKPKPNQQSNSQSGGGGASMPSTAATSTYTAPVCTETPLPQSTTYYVNLRPGQSSAGQVTIEMNGFVGFTKQCTADSNGYKPADVSVASVNRRIGVGDGGATYATPHSNWWESYETVYARSASACDELAAATNNDPIANQWCVTNIIGAIMHFYGY